MSDLKYVFVGSRINEVFKPRWFSLLVPSALQIIANGLVTQVVDAREESHSNWLRFVNCARNEDEQNLIAFQYRGEIYYRSYKVIEPGMELLVWYGDKYACDLDILDKDKKPAGIYVFLRLDKFLQSNYGKPQTSSTDIVAGSQCKPLIKTYILPSYFISFPKSSDGCTAVRMLRNVP